MLAKTVTIIKGNIITPRGVLYHGFVEVTDDTISQVGSSDVPIPTIDEKRKQLEKDNGGKSISLSLSTIEAPFVIPGFVDIHNHGVGGTDEVCDQWAEAEVSQKYLAKCGTLSVVASVIFQMHRPEATERVISTLEERVGKVFQNCAVIEGIHAEGPIIADSGGLPPVPDTSVEEFKRLCTTMPSMKVMTISPSIDARDGFARIKHLISIGVVPSLGHDRSCTETDVLGALQQAKPGTRLHSTHMFNVMGFHHREATLGNFALCDRLPASTRYSNALPPTVEIIGDLVHVNPIVVQSALCARSPEHIAFITDCISSFEPGRRCKYTGRQIVVRAEGGCYLCDSFGRPTKTLAGSTATMADHFKALISHFRVDIVTACLFLSTNPARFVGISSKVGSIEVGKKANLLLLNGGLNTIMRRMIYGSWVEADPHIILKPAAARL